jgi:hypothetical protein
MAYKGLEDRLINAGSPKSANNGAQPTVALAAPGIIPINNTFSKGNYEDFAIVAGVREAALQDTTD